MNGFQKNAGMSELRRWKGKLSDSRIILPKGMVWK